ncbi:MAG: TatD family hydrolase [Candidatus Korarchaeota archaeon]|nr:TatD family hydrolase [Thermoproteota archaeon]MCR8489011.1 TatD family hydrolase [Thermoproteota archaeon]
MKKSSNTVFALKLIDSHAHLSFDAFKNDLDEVILRAQKAGVVAIINPTISVSDFKNALKVAEKYPNVFPALGLAPQIIEEELLKEFLSAINEFKENYIAIGECGLDFYWITEPKKVQFMLESFKTILEIVEKLKKPLIIHARSAHHKNAYVEIIELLETYNIKRAVFHAFLGSKKDVQAILRGDWYISIPTVYVRRKDLWFIVNDIPLDRMLIETDSPYLASRKGSRNEPSYIVDLLELISRITGINKDDIAYILTKNAIDLFELKCIW